MLKVNNRNIRGRCEICSKLTGFVLVSLLLTLDIFQTRCSSVSIINFEHVITGWAIQNLPVGNLRQLILV